jgi:DNA-binding LacI/PurR family transcriptional regulator
VASDTAERVRAAAAKLNFTPHQAAQALAGAKAGAVALVIPEPDSLVLGDPFLSLVIRGISDGFHGSSYQVMLLIVHPDEPVEKLAGRLRPGVVDGAIVVSQHGSSELADLLAESGVPVVFIGRPWVSVDEQSGQTWPFVDVDNWLVGQLAAERLISREARNIACIAGPVDMNPVRDRLAGWRQTLEENGLEPGPIAHGPFTRQGGEEAMRLVLAADPTIDAVFAQSDLMAAGALVALRQAGDLPGVRQTGQWPLIGRQSVEDPASADRQAFSGDEGPFGRVSPGDAGLVAHIVADGGSAGSGHFASTGRIPLPDRTAPAADSESAVLLVSVDNSDIATSTTPTLTSVTNPGAELAKRASRILLRLIEDGVAPSEVAPEVIRPALVVRASG